MRVGAGSDTETPRSTKFTKRKSFVNLWALCVLVAESPSASVASRVTAR